MVSMGHYVPLPPDLQLVFPARFHEWILLSTMNCPTRVRMMTSARAISLEMTELTSVPKIPARLDFHYPKETANEPDTLLFTLF